MTHITNDPANKENDKSTPTVTICRHPAIHTRWPLRPGLCGTPAEVHTPMRPAFPGAGLRGTEQAGPV